MLNEKQFLPKKLQETYAIIQKSLDSDLGTLHPLKEQKWSGLETKDPVD